jgi:hypothetical protein
MSKGIDELARQHAPRAIELLADTMETAVEDRDKIRAAEAILDRGYGKPSQAIIAIPANRRQAALLAGMSDDDLVAIIESKRLPSLHPRQPLITISPTSSHGPIDSFPDADPLLL